MVTNQKIIDKLIQEGQKTIDLFKSLNETDWTILVYSEKMDWKVRDLLAHFISAEKSFLVLFDNIRLYNLGAPEGFSIDTFNNLQVIKMKGISSSDLIGLFQETRAQTVQWMNERTDIEMEKKGKHPALGEAKIIDMVKMIYLHNQLHLRDLQLVISQKNRNTK